MRQKRQSPNLFLCFSEKIVWHIVNFCNIAKFREGKNDRLPTFFYVKFLDGHAYHLAQRLQQPIPNVFGQIEHSFVVNFFVKIHEYWISVVSEMVAVRGNTVFIITFLKGQRNFADMNDTDTLGFLGGPIEHTPIPKRFGSSRIFINIVINAAR